jgi:3-hydroxybutyryl-CoA dehydrogenase
MASLSYLRCIKQLPKNVTSVSKRHFSATVRSDAEVKKLGVIGAGQMVRLKPVVVEAMTDRNRV